MRLSSRLTVPGGTPSGPENATRAARRRYDRAVRYREIPPPAPLAGQLRCFWILEGDGTGGCERILPDGCPEIVVHYRRPMARELGDGRTAPQPQAVVGGQLRTATILRPLGPLGMIGARFEPWAAAPFLRASLHDLTGRIEPLRDVWGRAGATLEEAVQEADSDEARVAVLARHLLERQLARAPEAAQRELAGALGWIEASRGAVPIEALADRLQWSRRRLERRFLDAVGLPPKAMARVARFQHVVRRLSAGSAPSLAALAQEAGFADQPHLARDFRELAGVTITAWLRERHELSDCFLAGPDAS